MGILARAYSLRRRQVRACAPWLAPLLAGLCGCDALMNPPTLVIPQEAVTLVLENRSQLWVHVDTTFTNKGAEVRRTTRRLAPQGVEKFAEIVPTQADLLTVDASEFVSPIENRVGAKLVRRQMKVMVDFRPGNTINVVIGPNPSAVIVAPKAVISGDRVVLDAGGSSDPEGGAIHFEWIQTAGPAVEMQGTRDAKTEFIAPVIPIGGESIALSFDVTLTNQFEQKVAIALPIRVDPPEPIQISTPGPREIRLNETAEIQASMRGGVAPFTFHWSAISHLNRPGALTGVDGQKILWAAPEGRLGAWDLRVEAVDAQGNVASTVRRIIVRADGDQIQPFLDCYGTGGCSAAPYADIDEDGVITSADLEGFIQHLLRLDGLAVE